METPIPTFTDAFNVLHQVPSIMDGPQRSVRELIDDWLHFPSSIGGQRLVIPLDIGQQPR